MEEVVMQQLFGGTYHGKTVFLTGHTGFKGGWMALWLQQLGAKVVGFSLPEPPSNPCHFESLGLDMVSLKGDIRNAEEVATAMQEHQPDIVFHMAAQPLVRLSYREPVATYATNVMGTIHVMEAARQCGSVKAFVNITSDKAYENREWAWGYRESDPMGGYDPYSSSKGCAELVTSAWRNSYFREAGILMASVRAGNVIGGGDWAEDRIIPDIFRAAGAGEKVQVRNPKAIRPWQHVLEPLSGYLQVGQRLLEGNERFAEAWNFGPANEAAVPVGTLVELCSQHWDAVGMEVTSDPNAVHEATLLKLDWSKAQLYLGWKPVWGLESTMEITAAWYRDFYTASPNPRERTLADLERFVSDGRSAGLTWAG